MAIFTENDKFFSSRTILNKKAVILLNFSVLPKRSYSQSAWLNMKFICFMKKFAIWTPSCNVLPGANQTDISQLLNVFTFEDRVEKDHS